MSAIDYPCGEPECIFCALHCPYCGQWPIRLDVEEGRMRCPTCGREDDLVPPQMIAMRHRQVLAISRRAIRDWKAQARQLSPRFHHRWRSTLYYLDPASSAALSRLDQLISVYAPGQIPFDDELYLLRGKAARRLFQRHLEANPTLSPVGDGDPTYLDDWF